MPAHRSPALALAVTLILFTFTPALAQWPQGFSATVGTNVAGAFPAAMADGNGGAYILYGLGDGTPLNPYHSSHYVTHAHYAGDATASAPSIGARSSLALAVAPNPPRGALLARFTLPDGGPARLELVDLAGRRVLAREVGGAGEHAEPLASEGLAPGAYVVRTRASGVRCAR